MRNALSSELSECLQALGWMVWQTEALASETGEPASSSPLLALTSSRPSPAQAGPSSVASLCRELQQELRERFFGAYGFGEREALISHLELLRCSAEWADQMARSWRPRCAREQRMVRALELLGEALRCTMPAVLRWGHGWPSGQAWRTLVKCKGALAHEVNRLHGDPTSAAA